MDNATYKNLTSRADAFHRGILTETIGVLERTDANLARRIRSQLERSPIPKPDRHDGGSDSDVFQVELFTFEVEEVMEALGDAEVAALGPDYSTTREASGFGTLLDMWFRYKIYLDENHAA